jgi:hypothetical protein
MTNVNNFSYRANIFCYVFFKQNSSLDRRMPEPWSRSGRKEEYKNSCPCYDSIPDRLFTPDLRSYISLYSVSFPPVWMADGFLSLLCLELSDCMSRAWHCPVVPSWTKEVPCLSPGGIFFPWGRSDVSANVGHAQVTWHFFSNRAIKRYVAEHPFRSS